MIFALAVVPVPTGLSSPVSGSGVRASFGTSMATLLRAPSLVIKVDITRLGIQLPLSGAGNTAGSPMADQINLPAVSEKPPMGFHAADGFVAIPNLNQPFHGKSLSFTVLMKIGELKPVCESRAISSTPSE